MTTRPQEPELGRRNLGQGLPAAPAQSPPSLIARARRQLARRRLPLTGALSVVGHLLVLLAVLSARPDPPKAVDPQLMIVQLVDIPPRPEPVTPPAPSSDAPSSEAQSSAVQSAAAQPAPTKSPPRRTIFRPTPVRADVEPLPAGDAETAAPGVEVSEAQLAGATTAGSGSGSGSGAGGGACNMPRWLQNALRKDPHVQAAIAEAHRGAPIMVWNGDWVRHPGQEGDGLAAIRESIMWEIGFAPEACRKEPVRGLVLLSLNDGPGSARLVVGSDKWRWSDLLFARSATGADAVSRR